MQFVLLLFGLTNAGVPFEQIGNGTYFVLAALLLGKPLGIVVFAYGARLAGARLPAGLRLADLVVVGLAAAIGFTVALFFATAAFPAGSAARRDEDGRAPQLWRRAPGVARVTARSDEAPREVTHRTWKNLGSSVSDICPCRAVRIRSPEHAGGLLAHDRSPEA